MAKDAHLIAILTRLLTAGQNRVRHHWFAGSLLLACTLFLVGNWSERLSGHRATVELQTRLADKAQAGGGVLVVTGSLECVRTLEAIGTIVEFMTAAGVAASGLVVDDGVSREVLGAVLAAANKRYPHDTISQDAVGGVVSLTGTPAFVGVSPEGDVVFVEHVSSVVRGSSGAEDAAHHLAIRLGAS